MHKQALAVLVLLLAVTAGPARAQELYGIGGWMEDIHTHGSSYSWSIGYRQPMGKHTALSFSWLNEGHVATDDSKHHRDGNTVQIWGRTDVLRKRLTLAVGFGPYRYYDTTDAFLGNKTPAAFSDDHGWGTILSFDATWHTQSRWLVHLRSNWTNTSSSLDTWTIDIGLGYLLDPVTSTGAFPEPPRQSGWTTGEEITCFGGQTVVNSLSSEHDLAGGIEYRRGIGRYQDWTITFLNEGDPRLLRRNGILTQLWAVRAFSRGHLALGVGAGAYLAVDRRRDPRSEEQARPFASGTITMTAAYRIGSRLLARVSWNRIVTDYSRDTDVLLIGLGYRLSPSRGRKG